MAELTKLSIRKTTNHGLRTMNYFLGVDAGGTQTKAVLINEKSQILGSVNGGPANYHNIGLGETQKNVSAAILQLLQQTQISFAMLTWATIGITACDTQKDFDRLFEIFSTGSLKALAQKLTVVRDSVVGLFSGTKPPGIVVMCGTGAMVYGINEKGENASAGNWGYFLGDQGSGYMLGKRMFESVIAAYDGRLESTILTQKLEQKINVHSAADVLDWYNDTKPSVHIISDFATLVLTSAEQGDEVSKQLLDVTVSELGRATLAVIKRLYMQDEAVRIVLGGGVFESKYFRTLFEGYITALIKRARVIRPLVSPAVGAAIMAKHEWEKNK